MSMHHFADLQDLCNLFRVNECSDYFQLCQLSTLNYNYCQVFSEITY